MKQLAFNAAIDDLGLSPVEFRVYCHILRRGECWESIPQAAKHCRMSESTYRRAIQSLVYVHKVVIFEERKGMTTIYRVAPLEAKVQPILLPTTPSEIDTPPVADLTEPVPDLTGGGVTDDTGGVSETTRVPVADLTPEVNTHEVIPIKERALEAFNRFEKLVGTNDANWLRDKRGFNFLQAVELWKDLLPDLWQLALTAPDRKPGDRPLWRFQEACERKHNLGLNPPKPALSGILRGQPEKVAGPRLVGGDHARTPDGQTRVILDVCANGMVVFEDDSPPVHLRRLEPVMAAVA